jgi:hypothetical protein
MLLNSLIRYKNFDLVAHPDCGLKKSASEEASGGVPVILQ